MPIRNLTIQAALHWAFATEHASLDFAEAQGDNARPGISTVWTIMQRGHLGCSVDGGGYSLPHVEADMIASAVAHLPPRLGGRGMALTIADHARIGSAPEWQTPAPQWLPLSWKAENQFGRDAATRVVDVVTYVRRGRKVEIPVLACPVRLTVTADRIAAARGRYTAWRAALAFLLEDLRQRGTLSEVRLVPGLPAAEPWRGDLRSAKVA